MPDADATLLMAPCFYAIGSIESLPSPPVRLKVLHICVLSHLSLDQRMLHSGNKLPSASTAFLDAFVLSRRRDRSAVRRAKGPRSETFMLDRLSDSSAVRLAKGPRSETFMLDRLSDSSAVRLAKGPRSETFMLDRRSDSSAVRLAKGPRSETFMLDRRSDSSAVRLAKGPRSRDLHAVQTKRFQRGEIGQGSEIRDRSCRTDRAIPAQ